MQEETNTRDDDLEKAKAYALSLENEIIQIAEALGAAGVSFQEARPNIPELARSREISHRNAKWRLKKRILELRSQIEELKRLGSEVVDAYEWFGQDEVIDNWRAYMEKMDQCLSGSARPGPAQNAGG
jgi:hypothetical protein